ncbi:hypothetical protein TanjilG_00561 [Lupinus angustifolius]|nr:hypothetical protein TanjilG_00561 [Lupinus angustifolius]
MRELIHSIGDDTTCSGEGEDDCDKGEVPRAVEAVMISCKKSKKLERVIEKEEERKEKDGNRILFKN